jgi:hypothetical protein
MSYRPQFNFPLFDRVTATLRKQGYDVISPAELDTPEVRGHAMASPDGEPGAYEAANDQTWADFLSRDVKIIADTVDAVVLLPQWVTSRGARLEAFVGLLCDHDFYLWDEDAEAIVPVEKEYVAGRVA